MLMAWGPYRFTIPNYGVETITRSVQPRVEAQPVISAMPTVHRLGPSNERITLQSTFFPHHFNGRGLSQLSGIRQAVNSLSPMMLTHINGSSPNVFGMWVATGVEDEQTMFDRAGKPSSVSATLSLMQYGGAAANARAIAMAAVAGSLNFGASIGIGGVSASLRIGF